MRMFLFVMLVLNAACCLLNVAVVFIYGIDRNSIFYLLSSILFTLFYYQMFKSHKIK